MRLYIATGGVSARQMWRGSRKTVTKCVRRNNLQAISKLIAENATEKSAEFALRRSAFRGRDFWTQRLLALRLDCGNALCDGRLVRRGLGHFCSRIPNSAGFNLSHNRCRDGVTRELTFKRKPFCCRARLCDGRQHNRRFGGTAALAGFGIAPTGQ